MSAPLSQAPQDGIWEDQPSTMLLLGKVPLGHAGQKKVFTSCINRAALSSERSLQLNLHYTFKVSFA